MISSNSSAFKTPKVQIESTAKISFQSNSKSCESSHVGHKTSAINTPPSSKKPPTGIHPYSQNTFQSSGFWVPNLSTKKHENKVKNIKHRSHSPARTSPVQSVPAPSQPIQSTAVSKKILESRWSDDVNCQCRFNNGNCCHDDLKQTTIVSERVSSRIQKLISEVTSSVVTTHKLQQRVEIKTLTNEAIINHGANKLKNSSNFQQSDSTQPGKHLRQTSADAASNYVSPFHNLNYCRKTNLNQTKVYNSERPSNQQLGASKVLEKSDEAALKDNLKRTNDRSPLRSRDDEAGDSSEKQENREEKEEKFAESKKTKEVLLSSIELPQIKTRTGSLTETTKESDLDAEFEGGGNRMRGLSLSASCLPFKPFQLQKPNLPWNRVSSVSICTTNSVDRKCQENFKNYVSVNIRPEQSVVVNHAKKRIESFLSQDEVRHSLPSLWKTGVFPSVMKEDNSCEDFSTSAESLHSVSTKCSIPSIQISTFDSNEDVHGSVASPFLGSLSPLCDSSSNECIRTPTPINKEDEEISQLPSSSSSSSPPPPVPPRNRYLYHNLRGGNRITSTNPEVQFGGRNTPSCAEGVNSSEQGVCDPTAGIGTTDRLSPQMFYDFMSRESQDYVMARMKHEKSHIDNQDSRRPYQSTAVTPRSKNSEILRDNSRDQRVQQRVESNMKEIQEIPINPVKASDSLHTEAKPAKRLPENLHLSPKSASLAFDSSPLPSPDEKLKNFVIPCLWFNSTPYDRLLISILDPRNTISDLDKLTSWEGYKRLLQPIGPDEWSPTSMSSTPSPTTSTDNSNLSKSSPLSQSPVSPFFRSKFSAFIAEEEHAEGGEVDEASNNTILNSVQTIVSNYQELESRIKKLLTTTTDAKTQERFSLLLQQMDTALQLIAKLTDQMTKLSSDSTLKGHARQNRLIEKLTEARDLKMNIDKKGEQLALKIKKSIDQKSFEMLEFLLKARTYVTLLNRSNFVNARRKASIPNIVIN